jgi:hypothetical protein
MDSVFRLLQSRRIPFDVTWTKKPTIEDQNNALEQLVSLAASGEPVKRHFKATRDKILLGPERTLKNVIISKLCMEQSYWQVELLEKDGVVSPLRMVDPRTTSSICAFGYRFEYKPNGFRDIQIGS